MHKKYYIIGGARSGKSYLAKQFSEKTGIPHYDLDSIEFVQLGTIERGLTVKQEKLHNILNNEKWIIEGVYTESWIIPALEKAEIIIWLDVSAITKLLRLCRQVIGEGFRGITSFYGRAKLAVGLPHKEWDRSHTQYRKLLQPYQEKVRVLRKKQDIQNFLQLN